jgi:hypothetical protein
MNERYEMIYLRCSVFEVSRRQIHAVICVSYNTVGAYVHTGLYLDSTQISTLLTVVIDGRKIL